MPKVIFFDAVGTLLHLERSVGEHYRAVAGRFGADLDAGELDRAFRAAWSEAPDRASNHRPRPDDDKGWWRALVESVLSRVMSAQALTAFDVDGYFEAVYAHFALPGVWLAYPEAREVLADLRARGIALGVISNFDRRLRTVLDHLQLSTFFDHVIISSEVGAEKPDPCIFQCALDAMRVTAAEAIHVGDDPKRDWGAESIGLRVFRLERPAGTLRGVAGMIDGHDPR